MRRYSTRAVILAVVVWAVVAAAQRTGAQQPGVLEKEVLDAQAERFRAVVAQDPKALERVAASELWYCRGGGDCDDKEHYVPASVGYRTLAMAPTGPMNVVPLSSDTAMVTGAFDQIAGSPDKPRRDGTFVILEFWVKRDGRWQLAKFRATDPPDSPHRYNECGSFEDVFNPGDRWIGQYLAGTKTGVEKAVLQAQSARLRAVVAGDAKAISMHVADALSYCDGNGVCVNKSKYPLRDVKVVQAWPEQNKVNVYGDVATVVGRLNQIVQVGSSQPVQEAHSYLEIYVKRDGRWQLIGHGATPVKGWSPHRCGSRTARHPDYGPTVKLVNGQWVEIPK